MCTFTDFASVIGCILGYVNVIIPLLAAVALIIFFWGIVRYVYSAGEGHSQGKELFLWGIIALFVLFSVYGILQIVCSTFLGGSCQGGNSTGVSNYIGGDSYQNNNPYGGPR